MKRKKTSRAGSPVMYYFTGALVAAVLSIIGTAIAATCILNGSIKPDTANYVVPCIQFLAVFISSIIVGKAAGKEETLKVSAATGVTTIILLAITNFLLFHGEFNSIIGCVVAILLGCGAGWLLLLRMSKPRSRKKHYR